MAVLWLNQVIALLTGNQRMSGRQWASAQKLGSQTAQSAVKTAGPLTASCLGKPAHNCLESKTRNKGDETSWNKGSTKSTLPDTSLTERVNYLKCIKWQINLFFR